MLKYLIVVLVIFQLGLSAQEEKNEDTEELASMQCEILFDKCMTKCQDKNDDSLKCDEKCEELYTDCVNKEEKSN